MINNHKELQKFIENLNKVTGLDFSVDYDLGTEPIKIEIDLINGDNNIGITIDTVKDCISIFASFYYSDTNKNDINDSYDEELASELKDAYENDVYTLLVEKCFYLFLKSHSFETTVCVWDDECYGCPGGGYNRVGYNQIPFSEKLILNFVKLYNEFETEFSQKNDVDLRKYIIERICLDHDCLVSENDGKFFINCNSFIILSDNSVIDDNVNKRFLGKEYFLFKTENGYYYSNILPIRIFEKILDYCEFDSDIKYNYSNGKLHIISEHLAFQTDAYNNSFIPQLEEMSIIYKLGEFIPFASSSSKILLEKLMGLIGINTQDGPLIITEGATDWKHMKKFWGSFKNSRPNCNLNFLEYEPTNSKKENVMKMDMGGQALLEMCKAFSKVSLERKFIFIADRDDPRIVKEFCDGDKEYKYWGNGVYSMVLPLPEHRIETPNICIEHYYTNQEIKKKYKCTDGVYRRLFLGNEFDEYGRGINERLLCTKRNICGKDSIKIIDGATDCRVVSFVASDLNNYALSKSLFVQKTTVSKNSVSYTSFEKLFKMIFEVLSKKDVE